MYKDQASLMCVLKQRGPVCESVCAHVCVCVWGGVNSRTKRGQKQAAGKSESGAAITN